MSSRFGAVAASFTFYFQAREEQRVLGVSDTDAALTRWPDLLG